MVLSNATTSPEVFKYQSGASKQLNTCSGTDKEIHVCDTCNKTFQFKCRLKLHLETHEVDSDKVCPNCDQGYKRSDFFQNDVAICSSKPSSEVKSVSKKCQYVIQSLKDWTFSINM